jgi:hypothetical protein
LRSYRSYIIHSYLLLTLAVIMTALTGCGNDSEDGQHALMSEMGGNDLRTSQLLWASNGSDANTPLLNVKVSSGFLSSEQEAARTMMEEWNLSNSDLTFFKTDEITNTDNYEPSNVLSYRDNVLGIYKSSQWFDNVSPSALAITQFFGIRRDVGTIAERIELIHADIIVNYSYFNFSTSGNIDGSNYDLASVLLHELGHFLGLPHQSDIYSDSIMHPYMSTYDIERSTYIKDREDLDDNYYIPGVESDNSAVRAIASTGRALPPRENDEIVYGIFELQSNGRCHHRIAVSK